MLAFFDGMCYYTQARYEEHAYAPVAQLDRVTDYESVGRGFESLLAYQKRETPQGVSLFWYARRASKGPPC